MTIPESQDQIALAVTRRGRVSSTVIAAAEYRQPKLTTILLAVLTVREGHRVQEEACKAHGEPYGSSQAEYFDGGRSRTLIVANQIFLPIPEDQ